MRKLRPIPAIIFGVAALGFGFGFLAAPTATGKLACAALGLFSGFASVLSMDFI